ncbi:hypothetical protein T439DRAFT_323506 [Meredithblackwellia eburnea MCA 4105]
MSAVVDDPILHIRTTACDAAIGHPDGVRPAKAPHPQRPPLAIRTDIFPSRQAPPLIPSRSSSFDRLSSTSTASVPWLRVEVPFDEEDPFAPATTRIPRPRAAKVAHSSILPDEAFSMLLHEAPPAKSTPRALPPTTHTPATAIKALDRRSSSSTMRGSHGQDASSGPTVSQGNSGMMQRGLSALGFMPSLSKKPSTASMFEQSQVATSSQALPLPTTPRRRRRDDSSHKRSLSAVESSPSLPFPPAPKIIERKRLDSSTNVADLPTTWAEYDALYAKGLIDIQNPPPPPLTPTEERQDFDLAINSEFPRRYRTPNATPYERENYVAPRPSNEATRQKLLARLDLLGHQATYAQLFDSTFTPIAPASPSSSDDSFVGRGPSLASISSRSSTYTSRSSLSAPVSSASTSRTSPPASPALKASPSPQRTSIQNDPALHSILDRCKEIFDTKIAVLSLLQHDMHVFLASSGMPDEVDTLPRSATFDAHTILNGSHGMVVLDTHRDWRFKKQVLSVCLGVKFYAGMPIYLAGAGQHSSLDLPSIGVLCIMDDRKRDEFTPSEEEQLRALAAEAGSEIESWLCDRVRSVATSPALSSSAPPSATGSSSRHSVSFSNEPRLPPRRSSLLIAPTPRKEIALEARYRDWQATLPMTPPSSIHRPSDGSIVGISVPTSPPTPPLSVRQGSPTGRSVQSSCSTPTVEEEPETPASSLSSSPSSPPVFVGHSRRPKRSLKAPPPRRTIQDMLDLATRTISNGLKLDLAYIVSVDIPVGGSDIISMFGLAVDELPPRVDAALHIRALRAQEGGLLYRRPASAGQLGPREFSIGLLIPVLEIRGKGYVFGVMSREANRNFELEELDAITTVAGQVGKLLLEGHI